MSETSSSLSPGRALRWRFAGVALLMLFGAAAGFHFGPAIVGSTVIGTIIGALLGFLIAWRIVETLAPSDPANGLAKFVPYAAISFLLATAAWTASVLIWGWVMIRFAGVFREGGLFIAFFMIPVTALCWLIGGPVATAAGRNALKQLQAGTRPESERWLAEKGILLSRAMIFTILVLAIWLLSKIYS